jgi:GNAT superfamily N-acetyltransferase
MPEPSVRLAGTADAGTVAGLIQALESHYAAGGRPSPFERTLAMVQASMTSQEGTRYALAFVDGEPLGLACFAVLRPGNDLRGLIYLKELFVAEKARGRAVGAALMGWLADHARLQGIGRIDLTTDRANAGAQAFYERLGAERLDKVVYRFDLAAGGLAAPRVPRGQESA